ncbi:MAG: TrkA family potassium uptake protein [Clostridia bacterium]|nr:TrkA family potassium uptake protein [Clostridia bacterium]
MKSFLVIGMGSFGKNLATKMYELGNDVMIVDQNSERIDELSSDFTDACVGDCRKELVLKSLGVNNYDVCFVTIGENFQSSLEITSLLKEMGAKRVVSKTNSEIQTKFLIRNGADEVINPEKEMAEKLAIRYNANKIFDFIELTPEFSIFEIPVYDHWVGKSIASLNIRNKYGITILAIKDNNELFPLPPADYVFNENEHIVVVGKVDVVTKLTSKM